MSFGLLIMALRIEDNLPVDRIKQKWPQTILIHMPIHASWLNQIEIYFSIMQRKILTPNYFTSLEQLRKKNSEPSIMRTETFQCLLN